MMHKAKTMTNWDRLEFHSCSGSMENLKELYEGIKLKPTCDAQIKRPQKENNPPACFFFFLLLLRRKVACTPQRNDPATQHLPRRYTEPLV